MEIRQTFIYFWQGFALLHNREKIKKASTPEKNVCIGRPEHKWRRFLKKHWAYVITVIAGFLLSLVIARLG